MIHGRALITKALLGKLISIFSLMEPPKNDLIVLNYHGTCKRFLDNFEQQIRFFQDKYHIISPSELEAFFEGKLEHYNKPYLLLSFDDGIKNNLFAAEVLNKYGIRAIFFIVPEFVNCQQESQAAFFMKNINPITGLKNNVNHEDFTSLSWSELKELVNSGHEVGSHSSTHTMRANRIDCNLRQYEIVESRRMLAEGLNLNLDKIRSFCGPVDSLLSVGIADMALIRDNYRFFFSTFPGSNISPRNPYFIKRIHVEAFWPLSAVKFALSNLERIRWRQKVKLFKDVADLTSQVEPVRRK